MIPSSPNHSYSPKTSKDELNPLDSSSTLLNPTSPTTDLNSCDGLGAFELDENPKWNPSETGGEGSENAGGNRKKNHRIRSRRHQRILLGRVANVRLLLTAFIAAKFLWRWYLTHRQRQHYALQPTCPPALRGYLNEREWEESRLLNMTLTPFKLQLIAPYVGLLGWLWLSGVRTKVWRWLMRRWRKFCWGSYQMAANALAEAEEKFDKKIQPVLTTGSFGVSCAWHGSFLFVVALALYLFRDFIGKGVLHQFHSQPIIDENLSQRVEALLAEFHLPPTSLRIEPGFAKTSHLGGILTKPVIIVGEQLLPLPPHPSHNDTTYIRSNGLDGRVELSRDEVIAVIGHELGHWHHRHELWRCLRVVELLAIVLTAFVVRNCVPLYAAFGYFQESDGGPAPWLVTRCLIAYWYLLLPLNELYTPLANLLSWHHEYQADAFVSTYIANNNPTTVHMMGSSLCSALVAMSHGQLLIMDKLFALYFGDHPSAESRLLAMGCNGLQ